MSASGPRNGRNPRGDFIAKCDIKLPDEFLKKVSGLAEKTDEIVEKALQAGGEIVLDKVRSNLLSVIGSNTKVPSRSTGELASALGLSPAKVNREGNHDIKVGLREPRSDGGSNAKLANIIEYGRHGVPAKPFLKPAKSASKKACKEAMAAVLEEAVKNI